MAHQDQQTRRVDIPAVQLPLSGLKAEYHIIRHQNKLQKNPLDAGMDLYPSEVDKVTEHGDVAVIWVHTFLVAHIGPGARGVIYPRSSSVDRLCGGQVILAIIDGGYTGELIVRVQTVKLPGSITATMAAIKECQTGGVAIAQLCVEPVMLIYPVPLPAGVVPGHGSQRGGNGFGS